MSLGNSARVYPIFSARSTGSTWPQGFQFVFALTVLPTTNSAWASRLSSWCAMRARSQSIRVNMENVIVAPSESSGLLPWLGEMLKDELAAYPGRGVMVARMVISATLTMILAMTFRIPGGFGGALFAFLIARDDFRSTMKSGIAIAVSFTIGVSFVLTCAALFASHPNARFLWFAGSMFVVFFALDTFQDYAIATGFAIILVLALPIWQTQATAEHRVELTLLQALACALGTVVTIAVEAVFHSLRPGNERLHGLDDRLSAVQGLIDAYAEDASVPEDVSNRLAKYTVVGVGGLGRVDRTKPA